MRIVTGAPARSNISSLYNETGWQSLSTCREILTLKMLYKTINGQSSSYLKEILLPRLSTIPPHLLRLRQNIESRPTIGDFILPHKRTSTDEHLFSYTSAKLWNKLPTHVKNQQTLKSFTKELNMFYKVKYRPFTKNYNLSIIWVKDQLMLYIHALDLVTETQLSLDEKHVCKGQ